MPRRACVLALPLGLLLAVAIGACGSGDAGEGGEPLTQPPLAATRTAPATTAATTGTTATAPSTTAATQPPTTTAATTPATTSTSTQPSGGAPAGCPSVVGGFIRDVRATDCGVARSVANAWFDAVHEGAPPDSAIDADGYSCSGTLAGERASVSCTGARGTVLFTASP